MALGRALELDGEVDSARLLYGLGLARSSPADTGRWESSTYAGLAAALCGKSGRDIAAEWWRWVADDQVGAATTGLHDTLEERQPALYERVLRTALGPGERGRKAASALAALFKNGYGDHAAGMKILEEAMKVDPGNQDLARELLEYHLERGDVVAAQSVAREVESDNWRHQAIALTRGKIPAGAPPLSQPKLMTLRVVLLPESGEVANALELVASATRRGGASREWAREMAIEVAGLAGLRPMLTELAVESFTEVDDRSRMRRLARAAGALATPVGETAFTALAERLVTAGVAPSSLGVARALLKSHRGDIRGGCADLEQVRLPMLEDPAQPTEMVMEILATGLWARAEEPTATRSANSLGDCISHDPQNRLGTKNWCNALCRGNRDAALAAARDLETRLPASTLAPLALAWELRLGSPRGADAEFERLVRAARYGRQVWLIRRLKDLARRGRVRGEN